jgi:hypothetical protein
MERVCEWFALCTNPTTVALPHPILGPTPCCPRCARKMGMADQLVSIEVACRE